MAAVQECVWGGGRWLMCGHAADQETLPHAFTRRSSRRKARRLTCQHSTAATLLLVRRAADAGGVPVVRGGNDGAGG